MDKVFRPNKTSARLMIDYARSHLEGGVGDGEDARRRYLLLYDLFIKARSCAIINKVAFWCAVLSGVMVLVWPSLAIVGSELGWDRAFLRSAVIQTTITAMAALTFAVYAHYKKRQLLLENLMRQVLHAGDDPARLVGLVLRELERIDTGFGFSQAILKNPSEAGESGSGVAGGVGDDGGRDGSRVGGSGARDGS